MSYLSVNEMSEKWRISKRRVQILCNEGRVDGAMKVGSVWIIPSDTEKPADKRKSVDCKDLK